MGLYTVTRQIPGECCCCPECELCQYTDDITIVVQGVSASQYPPYNCDGCDGFNTTYTLSHWQRTFGGGVTSNYWSGDLPSPNPLSNCPCDSTSHTSVAIVSLFCSEWCTGVGDEVTAIYLDVYADYNGLECCRNNWDIINQTGCNDEYVLSGTMPPGYPCCNVLGSTATLTWGQ